MTTKEIRKSNQPQRDAHAIANQARAFVARAVPKGVDAEHITLALNVALRHTPGLVDCDLGSLYAAVYQIAALGLLPGGPLGLAYMIPYGKRVQLIVGYRGMVQLAVGGGAVTSVRANVVARADDFVWREGLTPALDHTPTSSAPAAAEITHAYAIAELPGGGRAWVVLTRDDLEARRKSGASGKGRGSPWDTHYHEMAKKSAIRALCKLLPLSPDRAMRLARADAAEAGVLDEGATQALADLGYSADDYTIVANAAEASEEVTT